MPYAIRTNHVGFTVSDIDSTIKSFAALFGYVLLDRGKRNPRGVALLTDVPGAEIEVVHLHHPDLVGIELIAYSAPSDKGRITGRPCDTGHIHLTFDVTNIDAMVDIALENGFEKVGRIVQTAQNPSDGAQVVYLRNKDGITIELIQPPAS